jgi:HK97 family phage portal protein
MSAGTSWLARIGATFADARSAWKAAPQPGALYPPSGGAQTYYPINFPGWDAWERSGAGRQNGLDERRVKTALNSPWVYSDVQAIANELSAAELIVKERQGTKLEDVENHPLETLWESPNPHMGRSYLMAFWAWSYTLSGKAYLFWAPQAGKPAEVWPIPPFMIAPIPSEKDFIDGYAFKSRPEAKPIVIPSEYVTFSRSVNIFDVRDGLSFLAAAMLGIESDLAAAQWNRNFFADSNGVPDGMITVQPEMLDADLARVRLEIKDFFGGTRRGVAVARAGDMDYKPFGRSQKDAEWLAGRQFDGKMVDRTLGFPEGYWSERANRANAEQARATMIAGAVWPKLVALAEDLNAQTVPRWFGAQYRVEFKDIRPEDRDLKLKEMQARVAYLTIDELRELDGKEKIGDSRGALLVAEVGKGMTDGSPPAPAADPASLPPAELPEEDAPMDAPPPEDTPETPGADEVKAELTRWQTKALRAVRAGRSGAVRFESDVIPPDIAAGVSARLVGATDAAAVKAAFQEGEPPIDAEYDAAVRWAKMAMEG